MSKRKHQTIDLGTIPATGYSAEIDMSSFTHMNIFLEWPSGYTKAMYLGLQASPTEFGEDADWYTVYSPLQFMGAAAPDRTVFPNIPVSGGSHVDLDQVVPGLGVIDPGTTFLVELQVSEFPSPRRIRIANITDNTGSSNAAAVKVQLSSVV